MFLLRFECYIIVGVVLALFVLFSFIESIFRMYFTSKIVSKKSQTCCSKSHSSFVLFETLVIVVMSRLFASCLQTMNLYINVCVWVRFFCCSSCFLFRFYSLLFKWTASSKKCDVYLSDHNVTVNAKIQTTYQYSKHACFANRIALASSGKACGQIH